MPASLFRPLVYTDAEFSLDFLLFLSQGYAADQGFEATETNQGGTHQWYRVIVFAGVRRGLFETECGTIRTSGLRNSTGEQGEGARSAAVEYHQRGVEREVYGYGGLRVVVESDGRGRFESVGEFGYYDEWPL